MITITDKMMNGVTDSRVRGGIGEMVDKTLKKFNGQNWITSTTKLSDRCTPLSDVIIDLGGSRSDSKKSFFQCSCVSIINKTESITESCKGDAGSARISIIVFIKAGAGVSEMLVCNTGEQKEQNWLYRKEK